MENLAPAAVRVLVRARADRRRQIFRAPGERGQAGRRLSVGAEREHRAGRFRRYGRELHRSRRHARLHFQRVQVAADLSEVRGAVYFRRNDAFEPRFDDRGEVGERQTGVERVDAHKAFPAALFVLDDRRGEGSRLDLSR